MLPIGSWYYLKSGLKWRQQAQVAMSGTSPVAGLPYMTTRGTQLEPAMLDEHVSLITLLDCSDEVAQRELVQSFYQQFKETKKTNFIFFDTCSTAHDRQWIEALTVNTWIVACRDTVNQCGLMMQSWPSGKQYALVDRKGLIRSYYHAQSKDEKRVMLEHMALLIPREHSEKVELKRGQE